MTIVKDDVLSGDPRLKNRRVTVYHVVRAVDDFNGFEAAARELRISVEEVEEAIQYASDHTREIAEIEREYRELQEQENQ